ncbi:MAG: DUF2905 domain-containing protein [Rhabdochlamydiaceae bacterium]|nr:DUF2905 domain-containing protein [Rhabdochlamydiaceae bacterium]
MNVGKWLVISGIGLVVIGGLIWLGIPFGRLPGDIHIKSERMRIYIPIMTSIILSVVVSLVLWLLKK